MVAHFLEASTMFQTGDVLKLYGLIFGTLAVICVVNYMAAVKRQEAKK